MNKYPSWPTACYHTLVRNVLSHSTASASSPIRAPSGEARIFRRLVGRTGMLRLRPIGAMYASMRASERATLAHHHRQRISRGEINWGHQADLAWLAAERSDKCAQSCAVAIETHQCQSSAVGIAETRQRQPAVSRTEAAVAWRRSRRMQQLHPGLEGLTCSRADSRIGSGSARLGTVTLLRSNDSHVPPGAGALSISRLCDME